MPEFIHMPLLRNKDKSKISKRKNPVSLEWYRNEGYLPEALLNFLGNLGYSFSDGREIFSLEEMIKDFSWKRVSTSGPIFDLTKLDWMNGMYIRELKIEDLADRLLEGPLAGREIDRDFVLRISPLVQERLSKLNAEEFDAMAEFYFVTAEKLEYEPELLVPKKVEPSDVRPALEKMRQRFDELDEWDPQPMEDAIRALADELGMKAGQLFMAVRIAITGRKATPPLLESMVILGKDESLKRMDKAIAKAAAL
jgi:glutamyl-tRNA synthetase